MKVDVIMRTFNNDDILAQTLSALFSQSEVSFNLIVVDSGSTDNTLSILNNYPLTLINISSKDYIPGRVLNRGVEFTTQEYIFFLNSDTVLLHPNCLKNMLNKMLLDRLSASYGRQIARPDAYPEVQRDYLKSFPPFEINECSWITLSAPIMCIRREVLMEYKFYDKSWGSEDTEYGRRLKANGLRVGYVTNCTAMHSHNYSLQQLKNRKFVEGEADSFIYNTPFSPLLIIKFFLRRYKSFSISNFKVCSIRFLNFMPSFYEAYGYLLGLKSGNKRRSKGDKVIISKSYQ